METISIYSEKQDLSSALFYVNKTHKPMQIEDENTSAMLISLEDWKAIEETNYINSFPNIVKKVLDSDNEDYANMKDAKECSW